MRVLPPLQGVSCPAASALNPRATAMTNAAIAAPIAQGILIQGRMGK
jgi:hypothetical protein